MAASAKRRAEALGENERVWTGALANAYYHGYCSPNVKVIIDPLPVLYSSKDDALQAIAANLEERILTLLGAQLPASPEASEDLAGAGLPRLLQKLLKIRPYETQKSLTSMLLFDNETVRISPKYRGELVYLNTIASDICSNFDVEVEEAATYTSICMKEISLSMFNLPDGSSPEELNIVWRSKTFAGSNEADHPSDDYFSDDSLQEDEETDEFLTQDLSCLGAFLTQEEALETMAADIEERLYRLFLFSPERVLARNPFFPARLMAKLEFANNRPRFCSTCRHNVHDLNDVARALITRSFEQNEKERANDYSSVLCTAVRQIPPGQQTKAARQA